MRPAPVMRLRLKSNTTSNLPLGRATRRRLSAFEATVNVWESAATNFAARVNASGKAAARTTSLVPGGGPVIGRLKPESSFRCLPFDAFAAAES
jgi:hypothetical protein